MGTERPRQAILLSLKPRFAQAILRGIKTVELRRQRVALAPGAAVLIYASSPVMAIIGTARVRNVERDDPQKIWTRHAASVALTRAEYDAYLRGADSVSAITLEDPAFLDEPVTLQQLRGEQPFHPPQSYCFVSPSSPGTLGALSSKLAPA
ncbi:ASCH domain-containing protein [Actinoallomurus acaciae]|uniref:ASCH domain-containing protein n=1 Tax=Actinoallomurus acaciae TaxID=502577 RepID=A0ABV5YDV7_9ACTN